MNFPGLPGIEWHPSLPMLVIQVLAGLAALSALGFILFSKNLRPWAKLPVLFLRLATIAVLVIIALNPVTSEKAPKVKRSAAILLDRSTSMALGTRMADAWTSFEETSQAFDAGDLQAFTYSAATLPLEPTTAPTPEGRTTHLGDAIRRALDARPEPAALLVIGDGGCDDREALDAAAGIAKARGIPIHVRPVGGHDPLANSWIAGIRVPRSVRPQANVPIQVWVGARGIDAPLDLRLSGRDGETLASARVDPTPTPEPVTLEINAGIRPETFELELARPENDIIAEDNRLSFKLDVSSPKIRVLYMEGTHISHLVESPAHSARWNTMELKTRAWDATGEIETDILSPITQFAEEKNLLKVRRFLGGGIDFDPSQGFPASRDQLFKYDVIICGDVPRGNFSTEEMEWVNELVTRRGGGFCMIGGYTSFDSGDFDKTPWEKITPVDMVEYGHGYSNSATGLFIPDAVRDHPIWRISPDPLENARILDKHPAFHGFHDIRRAKPGAVNLGMHDDGSGPLITVQNYGRGRSMAFLSDTNGGWATEYIHWAGESPPASILDTRELGHGPEILRSTDGMTAEDAVPSGMAHPSPYFAQFWVNTVRWLGENSLRRLGEGITSRASDSVARPGATLELSAEITAGVSPEEMAALTMNARLLLPGAPSALLRWDRDRREFVGTMSVPDDIQTTNVGILFECETDTRKLTDRLDLPVLALNPEIEAIDAAPEFLRDLAAATGGREILQAGEAADALAGAIEQSEKAEIILLQPAWDGPLWWGGIVGLLGLEWLVRKLGRRPA